MLISRRRLVQPAAELVGGEEAAFIKQFPDGGEVGRGDGIAGAITAKHQQAARTGMLEHEVGRLGRFRKAESFKKCSEVGETSLLGCPSCPTRSSTWTN